MFNLKMGAQHAKSHDNRLTLQGYQQQCEPLECNPNNLPSQAAEDEFMNDVHRETVMSTQNLILDPKQNHCITVADFAKIKTEQLVVEDHRNIRYRSELLIVEENQDLEHQNTGEVRSNTSQTLLKPALEESTDAVLTVALPNIGDDYIEFNSSGDQCPNYSNIELKKELLETHGLDTTSKIVNENICEIVFENQPAIKIETAKDLIINEPKNIVQPITENFKSKKEFLECENSDESEDYIEQLKIVKNPFAILKKVSIDEQSLTQKNNKEDSINKTIKSELIHIDEELDTTSLSISSNATEITKENNFSFKQDVVESSINLNELPIKSENILSNQSNQDILKNNPLNFNCLSCNLLSSVNANLTTVKTDFEEALSIQSTEAATSKIASAENKVASVEQSELKTSKRQSTYKSYIGLRGRPIKNKTLQDLNRRKRQKKCGSKPLKRKPNPKSKKYSEKDYSYKIKAKNTVLKDLPKTHIKTRKKRTNLVVKKQTSKTAAFQNDFPKPFKLERSTLQKEQSIAAELPRPIMFKIESDISVKNKKSYLKPQFQPSVRLKRLNSEELLVPLKTRHLEKTRRIKNNTNIAKRLIYTQMASDNRRDFLIQKAFSLNPLVNLKRLSSDHDRSYYCDQPSSYSRLTTPNSTPNESFPETESKYFSPEELLSLFHPSTPGSDSLFSGHMDSGVSTSTPSLLRHTVENNKTLLLEIAAERAFINNHLIRFGYSSIQFDLFNNLNDLTVFSKYLFGNLNLK